jgi:hypothetical protein
LKQAVVFDASRLLLLRWLIDGHCMKAIGVKLKAPDIGRLVLIQLFAGT